MTAVEETRRTTIPGLKPVPIIRSVRTETTHEYQYCSFGPRAVRGYGKRASLWVSMRFDDECKNGHDTFAITAHVTVPGERDWVACGCLHTEIAQVFPELTHLIKWHLVSTDSPMHYVANTIYHASNRDHRGLLKGERSTNPRTEEYYIRFGNSPIRHKVSNRLRKFILETLENDGEFILDAVPHGPDPHNYTFDDKYQFAGMDCKWHECPFDTMEECREWIDAITGCELHWSSLNSVVGEGKERDFNAARSCGVWPDATDEQLMAEPEVLKAALLERLPELQRQFREAMESIGFVWLAG